MTRNILLSMIFLAAGASSAWGATVFDHQAHLGQYVPDSPCTTCHKPDAQAIVPDKSVCLDCHDQAMVDEASLPATRTHGPAWALNHRSEAKAKVIDCEACHEQKFCLDCHKAGFADEMGTFGNAMVNVHRGDFHVSHPVAARTNPQLCRSCHENDFCVECHNDFRRIDLAGDSHRRTWSNSLTPAGIHANIPDTACQNCHVNSVLPTHAWTDSHAREARKNLATCQACHPEGDICIKCHSAKSGLGGANPHPRDWGKIKDRLKNASNLRSCLPCHDPNDPALR